jgi:hypothetical protein
MVPVKVTGSPKGQWDNQNLKISISITIVHIWNQFVFQKLAHDPNRSKDKTLKPDVIILLTTKLL